MECLIGEFLSNKKSPKELRAILASQCNSLPELAQAAKSSATEEFKQGRYLKAAEFYTACIICTDEKNNVELCGLYSNRSLCYQKLGKVTASLADAVIAIRFNQTNYKPWLRLGTAYAEAKEFKSAVCAIDNAIELCKGNAEYCKILAVRKEQYANYIWRENNKMKYDVDYSRFMKIPDIVNEPSTTGAGGTGYDIEYSSSLSENQRKMLDAQLTGSSPTLGDVSNEGVDLCSEFKPSFSADLDQYREAAVCFIKTMVKINSRRCLLDRFFDLHHSVVDDRYIRLCIDKAKCISMSEARPKVCIIGCGSLVLPMELMKLDLELDIVVNRDDHVLALSALEEHMQSCIPVANVKIHDISPSDRKSHGAFIEEIPDNLCESDREILCKGLRQMVNEKTKATLLASMYDLVVMDPDLFDSFLLNPLYDIELFEYFPSGHDYMPARVDITAVVANVDLSNYLLVKEPWTLAPIPVEPRRNKVTACSDSLKLASFHLKHWQHGYKAFLETIKSDSITINDVFNSAGTLNFEPNCVLLSYQIYSDEGLIYASLTDNNLERGSRKRSPYMLLLRPITLNNSQYGSQECLQIHIKNQTFTGASFHTGDGRAYSSHYIASSTAFPNVFPSITKDHAKDVNDLFRTAALSYRQTLHSRIKYHEKSEMNILFFDCRSFSDIRSVIESLVILPYGTASKYSTVKYNVICCSTNSLHEIRAELRNSEHQITSVCQESIPENLGLEWKNYNGETLKKVIHQGTVSSLESIVKFSKSFIYQTCPKDKKIKQLDTYKQAHSILFNGNKIDTEQHITLRIDNDIHICFLGGIYYAEYEPNPLNTQMLQQALYIRTAFSGRRKTIICPGIIDIYAVPFTCRKAPYLYPFMSQLKGGRSIDTMKYVEPLMDQGQKIFSADLNTITVDTFSRISRYSKEITWEFAQDEIVHGTLIYAEYTFGMNEGQVTMSHAPASVQLKEGAHRFSSPQQTFITFAPVHQKTLSVLYSFDRLTTIIGKVIPVPLSPQPSSKVVDLLNIYQNIITTLDGQYYNALQFRSNILPVFQSALIQIAQEGLEKGMDYGVFDEILTYIHTFGA